MKKNRLFVLGLVTVFVALVSLTFVSSTWAKYTTTASGSDSARVAYWGFTQNTLTLNLFEDAYDHVEDDVTDIIAPGTESSQIITFEANDTYAPEVDYKVTYTFEASAPNTVDEKNLLKYLDENENFKWTFQISGGGVQNCNTIAELETKVEALSKTFVPANTNYTETFTIGWVWDFGTDDPEQDADDTFLGNNAYNLHLMTISITVVAEQVNEDPLP